MMRAKFLALTVCVGALVFAGCGSSAATPVSPDVIDGQELFEMRAMGGKPGCVTCHSLGADTVLVGPSLDGLGSRAGTRVPGVSAQDYVRQSIVDPEAFVVGGFPHDKMPKIFGDVLNDRQLDALVDYLLEPR